MTGLSGREIILGVTGGIAAYKAAELVRLLKKQGAGVQVVMTRNATRFITPLTFQTLSERPVLTEMFSAEGGVEISHIALADRADVVVIAPATANIIGKMAAGIADDLLSTFLLAADCPIFIAPAMNNKMFLNRIVQSNIEKLKELGVRVIEPGIGELACRDFGPGRMAEPQEIAEELKCGLSLPRDLENVPVLVTAGPTREKIDPVRFISNPSTGKMGFALAEAARNRGAKVTLISGPSNLRPPRRCTFIGVESARQMREAVIEHFDAARIVIMAAAVADYQLKTPAAQKIKKSAAVNLNLELIPAPDILLELGRMKGERLLVGFAAETHEVVKQAEEKLIRKNLDLIVANDVSRSDAGFGADSNQVTIVKPGAPPVHLPLMSKEDTAHAVLDHIVEKLRLSPAEKD